MLTKDLVSARTRTGKLFPNFLVGDTLKKTEPVAESLQKLFENSVGMQINKLEESIADILTTNSKVESGLVKLLMDRITEEEVNPKISDHRFEMILKAQSLRRVMFSEDINEHRLELESVYGKSFKDLSFDLYADLPEFRKIKSFKPLLNRDLLNRYNVAQVQAHLIHSRYVKITVGATEVAQIRAFIRKMKFSRLYADISKKGSGKFEMKLSGPLSVFQNSQAYGLRIANFFPHILEFSDWSIESEVRYKNKDLILNLNNKSMLKPVYKNKSSYIPSEFNDYVTAINSADLGFELSVTSEFFDLGNQNYSFPDFELKNSNKSLFIELFHRWHWSELTKKVEAIDKNPKEKLFFFIERGIANKQEVKELKTRFSSVNLVEYSGFPTVKVLEKILNHS